MVCSMSKLSNGVPKLTPHLSLMLTVKKDALAQALSVILRKLFPSDEILLTSRQDIV